MEPRTPSPTDLSDNAGDLRKPLVPAANPGGRPATSPTREILTGSFSLVRGGWAWRLLPHDWPPWPMVDQDCWRWRQDGPGPRRQDVRRGARRVAAGKRRQPSAGMLASPSVQTTEQGGAAAVMPTNRATAARGLSVLTRAG
jgi:transposase